MPILNYTTKVDTFKTVGEIQSVLVKHGAKKIMQDYDEEGRILALTFMIDTPAGQRGVRLPADVTAVLRVLENQRVKADLEQAERVAWRIIKDWVEAQMALLESAMAEMDEIFLPYMVVSQNGQTLFEKYRENQLLLEAHQ